MTFEHYISNYNPTNIKKMLRHTSDSETNVDKVFEQMNNKLSTSSKLEFLRAYIKFFEFNQLPTDVFKEALAKLNKESITKPKQENKVLNRLYNEGNYKEYVMMFLLKNYNFDGALDEDHHLSVTGKYVKFKNGDFIYRIGHKKFMKAFLFFVAF